MPFWFAINNLVDSATCTMTPVIVVAFPQVMPVGDENTTIRTIFHRKATKPTIIGEEKIIRVNADVGGPFGNQSIIIEPIPVKVGGEKGTAKFIWPVMAEVDHSAAMCMTTPGHGMLLVGDL